MPFLDDSETVEHASGRPWLVGTWSPRECTVVTTAQARVAVIGYCPVAATRLAELAASVRLPSDAAALARRLPGSFHLVASVAGVVHVQGVASGLRGVFCTTVDGVPVASNRADVLAALVDADVDEGILATRVVCGKLPPPLGERSMWGRVSAVPPDHALTLRPDRAATVRWWTPPEPCTPLFSGASRLKEVLETAVSGRLAEGRLSADLSGGMDSTSLCFLAARTSPDLLTVRWGEAEAGNDDALFAATAARSLDRAEHLLLPQEDLPELFASPHVLDDTEQPYPFSRTSARTRHTARALAERGSRLHIAGHGGDELFTNLPNYLYRLLRRHPLTALRHVRGYRALSRWPLRETMAPLIRIGGIRAWWRKQAEELTAPTPKRIPPLGWGILPLRASAWATPEALETARIIIRETADNIEPFADDPGQHQFLFVLRANAPTYRQLCSLHAQAGPPLHLPFYDDRVVEAALAVQLHERATPWRYKALLAEAMRGVVPDDILGRSTKAEFSADLREGLRRNLPAILELFADSALAARGLIDPDTLRARLLAPHADLTTVKDLEDLLGCETWLRAATQPAHARRIGAFTTTS
jgi:asparagine synthase (glutamine-hydrolysing)